MKEKENPVTASLRAKLHVHFDSIVSEPLPERLTDLLNRLREREQSWRNEIRDKYSSACGRPTVSVVSLAHQFFQYPFGAPACRNRGRRSRTARVG